VNLEARSIEEVWDGVRLVARKAGVTARGEELALELSTRIAEVAARSAGRERVPIAFLEWLDPPFSCGHWNPDLVRMAGAADLFGRVGEPARVIDWGQVTQSRPELIFVAECGFGVERTLEDLPALANVPRWLDVPAVRNGRVYVTDGSQYFSRPGPRLADSLEILAHAVDPELHPLDARLAPAIRVDVAREFGRAKTS
jgi:iron complex transport system substrate-binding protein